MHESDLISYYLDVFLQLLTTPTGVIGLFLMLAMAGVVVTIQNSRWVFVALAIYFATIPLIDAKTHFLPLAFPLEQFRAFARPMIYFFLALLLLPLVMSQRGWRRTLISWPLILFFAFEIAVGVRLTVFGGALRGLLSIGSYVLLLLTLGIAVSRWLQTFDDFFKLMWSVNLVAALVVSGTCYQLVINRTPIISGNRLTGISSNPQFLAILISYTLPFTCYLLMRSGGRKWVRPLLIAQISVTVVFLIWTGSRTGALSTVAALLVSFHRRLGRSLILGIIILGVVVLALPYFQGSSEIASRLISTQDTRAGVWPNLLRIIRENFWFGEARETFEVQESSYLSILAQFGVIGAIPFVLAVGAMILQIIQLRRLRHCFGQEHAIVDMICGIWAAIMVSSALEAVLLGVITFPVLSVYVFASMTTFLVDWGRGTMELAAYSETHDDLLAAA